MTKLMEWLSVFGSIFILYVAVITNIISNNFTREYMYLILYSPIFAILLFGIYAATVVLYRVFTFNNCEEAAIELKKEIQMAKEDLKTKGFIFK